MSKASSWTVDLTGSNEALTDTCLYVPPRALPDVKLPRRLLAQGPNGEAVLVGSTRVDGADDQTAIGVSQTLLDQVAPASGMDLWVSATIRRASWVDVFVYTEREDAIRVVVALVIMAAALSAAIVAFITRAVGIELAAVVLVLASLAAGLAARSEIREALTPKCR